MRSPVARGGAETQRQISIAHGESGVSRDAIMELKQKPAN